MKRKIILGAIALLSSILSFAQTTSGAFVETRTAPASQGGAKTTITGQLVYKNSNYLSMVYDNGDVFLIDGDKMTIRKGENAQSFDTTKNLLMKALSHTLIYSFKGTLDELAVEQDADIKTEKSGYYNVVTLTARKKAARGYSKIIVRYNISDGHIHDMTMVEFTGASTFYTLK